MTDKHDFFNFVDIRKLNEISYRIKNIKDNKIKDLEQSLNRVSACEPKVPTEEELIVASYYNPKTSTETKNELEQLYSLGLSPATASVIQANLLSTLLAIPEYREIVSRLAVLIKLEHSNKIIQIQNMLDSRIAQAENDLIKVRKQNKNLRAKLENTFRGQDRVFEEAQDLMVVRKNKMIRSMNKALEAAGEPDHLSSYDYGVYKIMKKYDLVGYDGSRWCCKEPALLDMDDDTFSTYTNELFEYASFRSK